MITESQLKDLNNKLPQKHFMTRGELFSKMFLNSMIIDKDISQNWVKIKIESGEIFKIFSNKIERAD
jgi:hypothetical protein